jgi:hypothetical protein
VAGHVSIGLRLLEECRSQCYRFRQYAIHPARAWPEFGTRQSGKRAIRIAAWEAYKAIWAGQRINPNEGGKPEFGKIDAQTK